ncbi:MAG TPA: YidC/Oxa1 family insertase periplasmic-domain containing protein [Phycisphaerae bacterium]|nr:YidC/Oxa1 family insertase periplasmic-domain containing protein [Phycisphaerae bacterium]
MSDNKRLLTAIAVAMVFMVAWQILTAKIWGLPPRPDAGPDQVVPTAGGEDAQVALDGSNSQDPDSSAGTNDDLVAFEWYENYGQRNQRPLGSGQELVVTLAPGVHEIVLAVTDRKNRTETDRVLVTVEGATTTQASQPAAGTARGLHAPSTPELTAAPDQAEASQPDRRPAGTAPATPDLQLRGAEQAETAILGSDDPEDGYNLAVYLTNENACVLAADVTTGTGKDKPRYRFRKSVEQDQPYPLLRPLDPQTGEPAETLDTQRSVYASLLTPTLRLFRGKEVTELSLEPQRWNLRIERTDQQHTAVFSLEVDQGDRPLLRLEKTLTLAKGRYDLVLSHRVVNLTDEPVTVSLTQHGAHGLQREDARSDYRKIVTVSQTADSINVGKHARSQVYKRGEPLVLADAADARNLVYSALVNKYFTCIMGPQRQADASNELIDRAEAITEMNRSDAPGDLTTRWVSLPFEVPANGASQIQFDLYWGPKLKTLFERDPTYVARHYLTVVSVEFACCWQGLVVIIAPLADMLLWLLHALHYVLPNYGVAIIIMVLIVRVMLHPITKKGQVSMLRMQKQMQRLAPKTEALKQQYGSDRQKFGQEQMRMYREEGINPMTQMMGCLPMGLQMPIWIALYTMLNTTLELRHQPFVLWIRDLAAPDALIHFGVDSWVYRHSGWVPFLGPIDAFNLLPIVLGITMYLQQRLMPKPATPTASTDQQKQQQMMMNLMSVFMTFIFYNMPSGLNLYIGASSLFGALEQWRIRQHIDKMDDQAPAPAKERARGPQGVLASKPRAKTGWWAKLERKVEQAKRVDSGKKGKRPRR